RSPYLNPRSPLPCVFVPLSLSLSHPEKPRDNPANAAMRPLIRTACLRARVRAMATLPTTAAFSSTRAPSPCPSPSRARRLLFAARFLPSAPPPPAGARAFRTSAAAAEAAVEVGGVKIAREDVVKEDDPTNNVPDTIYSKIGLQLHRRDNHPLGILKNTIYDYFDKSFPGQFVKFDDLCPLVSTKQNFDDVLVPADHVSRSYNDTYYVDSQTVLRCHTSAHQAELLREGHRHFLVIGDVYRRDSIDSTHYPVFHQMEGFRVFSPDDWSGSGMDGTAYAATDLKKTLEGLATHLFGAVEMRWVDTYFPFTNPSFELEIYFQVCCSK
uniref:Phenylalanyl-tRNA synthetase domain-containing protein n=1 Tax=Aegilops tauschii subsp. strangulata TaxID=200361 RepID=A0A453K1P6_AEGTS